MFRAYLYLVCGFAISSYGLFLIIGAGDLASFLSTGSPSVERVARQLSLALTCALLWASHLPALAAQVAKRKRKSWFSISISFVQFAYGMLWLPMIASVFFAVRGYASGGLLVRVAVSSCALLLALYMRKFSLPYLEQIDPNGRKVGLSKYF